MNDASAKAPITLFRDLRVDVAGRTVVSNGTLSVVPASITVLMGPSGVGKSVLADVVFRMGLPSSITVDGEIGGARDTGALVFQDGGGLPHLTVRDNLRFVAAAGGTGTEEMLDHFGLAPDTLSAHLSGGERRRLAVARSLLAERNIVWLDEPDAGLDLLRVNDLAALLKDATRDRHLAMIITTHNVQFAAEIADRIVFLGHDGALVDYEDDGPSESDPRERERAAISRIEHWLASRLGEVGESKNARSTGTRQAKDRGTGIKPVEWLARIGQSLPFLFAYFFNRPARKTLSLALSLSAVRGAVFYPFIGAVLGGVFVLIFQLSVPRAIDAVGLINEFGASIVLRVSPPIAAMLVAACAGSTIASWLGQMTASRQLDALSVLGVRVDRWVLGPIWWGLCLATVVGTATFALAFAGVFSAYVGTVGTHVTHTAQDFWSSFVQPTSLSPGSDLTVAIAKAVGYGALVAAITTVRCTANDLRSSSDVASAVTSGIVWSTVIVMATELLALVANYLFATAT